MFIKVISLDMLDKFILEAPSITILDESPTGDLIDWTIYTEQSIFIEAQDARMFVPVEHGDMVVVIDNDGKLIKTVEIELE